MGLNELAKRRFIVITDHKPITENGKKKAKLSLYDLKKDVVVASKCISVEKLVGIETLSLTATYFDKEKEKYLRGEK